MDLNFPVSSRIQELSKQVLVKKKIASIFGGNIFVWEGFTSGLAVEAGNPRLKSGGSGKGAGGTFKGKGKKGKREAMMVRYYVRQTLSEKLDESVFTLLQTLNTLQLNGGVGKKFLKLGLREILRGIKNDLIRGVVVAPNVNPAFAKEDRSGGDEFSTSNEIQTFFRKFGKTWAENSLNICSSDFAELLFGSWIGAFVTLLFFRFAGGGALRNLSRERDTGRLRPLQEGAGVRGWATAHMPPRSRIRSDLRFPEWRCAGKLAYGGTISNF